MKKNYTDAYLVYARKSDESTDKQKNSIAYQVRECSRFAECQNLAVADVTIPGFTEDGVVKERHTAFKTDGIAVTKDGTIQYKIARPKFQQLVKVLVEKKYKGVIALCWDRISRNDQDGMVVKKLLEQGVDVRFVWVDYSKSSSGILHMDIDGMFASHYSRVISEKVKASNEKIRSEGNCLYIAPVGYLDKGSRNKPIDPVRAPLVKELFKLYATGEWSISQLTAWARKQGLTSKPSRPKRTREELLDGAENTKEKVAGPIGQNTVHRILRNPFFIGKLKYGNDVIDGNHQPLISASLFNRVQKVLEQSCVSRFYLTEEFFCYRGYVRCLCGRSYSPYEKKGHNYYRAKCRHNCDNQLRNVSEDIIDEKIEELLDGLIIGDKEIRAIEAHLVRRRPDLARKQEVRKGEIERRRKRTQDDLDYLKREKVALLRTGAYSPDEYQKELALHEKDLVALEQEMEVCPVELEQEIHGLAVSVSELLKSARLCYRMALDVEKRDILKSVVSELVLYDRNIASFTPKKGFTALQKWRDIPSGSPDGMVSELLNIRSALLEINPGLTTKSSELPRTAQRLKTVAGLHIDDSPNHALVSFRQIRAGGE